jgi:hypothetical protein
VRHHWDYFDIGYRHQPEGRLTTSIDLSTVRTFLLVCKYMHHLRDEGLMASPSWPTIAPVKRCRQWHHQNPGRRPLRVYWSGRVGGFSTAQAAAIRNSAGPNFGRRTVRGHGRFGVPSS